MRGMGGSRGVKGGGVDGLPVDDDEERREDAQYVGEESLALGADEGISTRCSG